MILAMIFAHVWGVLQLIVLGSFARTVRLRTLLTAMAVGLYACAPLAGFLERLWTRSVATLTNANFYVLMSTASYTLDPFIEETMKVLPLAVLLMLPVTRRQWSITDCVLIGAAGGAGFGLAEDLYKYAASPDKANAINGGWDLATNISLPFVSNVQSALHMWLPPGASALDDVVRLNVHLFWSTLGGLAVGLIVLTRSTAARVAGLLLLLYVGL